MNDKIRDLMRSAIISVDCITGDESLDEEISKMYIPDCFAEKFAELIVRECAHIADNNYDCGKFPVGHKIKEHFGVEK